jgi:hypothetical protein
MRDCWKIGLTLAFVVSGCSEPRNTRALYEDPRTCDSWGCGNNSASLGGVAFHELNVKGEPNDQGLVVDSFSDSDGNPLGLVVTRDQLYGVQTGGSPLSGTALELSTIALHDSDGTDWILRIRHVDETQAWVPQTVLGNDPPPVPVYQFDYYRADHPLTANEDGTLLCPPSDEPLVSNYKGTAIIFTGDRYDARAKTVSESGLESAWFNIGCEKTAVAKMHLLQHTLAAGDHQVTKVEQRQAVLKMITADYCGNGVSYTMNGHVLRYKWAQSWEPLNPHSPPLMPLDSDSIEAYWNSERAICLSRPRLEDVMPGTRGTVACNVPYCDDNWPSGAYVMSTNPALTDMGM